MEEQTIRLDLAIVEDEPEDAKELQQLLIRYLSRIGASAEISSFRSGVDFLKCYKPIYDLVFLDIELPNMNGMTVAKRLREADRQVGIIFVTNLPQYAINGYEVGALDYLIKPITAPKLARTLSRVLDIRALRKEEPCLTVPGDGAEGRDLLYSDIYYIEKEGNYIVFHTRSGILKMRGTMRELEDRLSGSIICKCANGCMVNLRYIQKKSGNEITVEDGAQGIVISVSKPYRASLTEALMKDLRMYK